MNTTADSPRLFVNTYRPLVATQYGREAARRHQLPPFVDGSIRREPDLEHDWPSISCLCRAGQFAPRLRVRDCVVYLAAKSRYGEGDKHRRLTAILQVARRFETHQEAADWYRSQKLRVPTNCMVLGNPPLPLDMSSMYGRRKGDCGGSGVHELWDAEYQRRSECHGRFIACKPLYRNLSWEAPKVHEPDLLETFGEIPATQNPGAWQLEKLEPLMRWLRIHDPLSGS